MNWRLIQERGFYSVPMTRNKLIARGAILNGNFNIQWLPYTRTVSSTSTEVQETRERVVPFSTLSDNEAFIASLSASVEGNLLVHAGNMRKYKMLSVHQIKHNTNCARFIKPCVLRCKTLIWYWRIAFFKYMISLDIIYGSGIIFQKYTFAPKSLLFSSLINGTINFDWRVFQAYEAYKG